MEATNNQCSYRHTIFEQFDTVVILKEQMCIWDAQWMVTPHVHTRDCTTNDIAEIHKLVITEPNCILPKFNNEPWNSAVLITLRHGMWNPWNQAAIEQPCTKTGNILYTFDVEDTVRKDCSPLSIAERVTVAGMQEKKQPISQIVLQLQLAWRLQWLKKCPHVSQILKESVIEQHILNIIPNTWWLT